MKPEEAKKILEQAEKIKADPKLMKKIEALDLKKGPKSIDDLRKMREEASKEEEPKVEVEVTIHNTNESKDGGMDPMKYMADEDKVALREIARVEKSIADCFPENESEDE